MSIKAGVTMTFGLALSWLLASPSFADISPPHPGSQAQPSDETTPPSPSGDQSTAPNPAANDATTSAPAQSEEEAEMVAREAAAKALVKRDGVIALPGGQATITLSDGFSYLDQADAEKLLTKVWGNPPGAMGSVMGAIVPRDIGMLDEHSWAAVITYSNDGHVSDGDASAINYDDLLKQMQTAIEEGNAERTKQGYEAMTLVGWAQKPSYNAAEHKLYWAKHVRFGANEEMLNYAIRALGRTGVLEINVIADMKELPAINTQIPKLLSTISFTQSHRYTDFNESSDPIAAYGLAALVAGGVAAKAGLLKWLLAAAVASWKLIAVGVAAVGAMIARFFRATFGGGKGSNVPPAG